MKIIEINERAFINNLKKNYKISIVIFLICLLMGVVLGLYQGSNYSYKHEVYSGENNIDIATIEQDGAYYFNAFNMIKTEADWLDLYFRYLHSLNMSTESRDALKVTEDRFYKFYDGKLNDDVDYYWNTPLSLDKQDTVSVNNDLIGRLERKKEKANNEWDLLKEGNHTSDYLDMNQELLEKQISSIDEYVGYFHSLDEMIVESNTDTINNNNAEANKRIDLDVKELNSIIDEFNLVLEKIADSENYEIIYNKHVIEMPDQYLGLLKTTNNEELITVKMNKAYIYAKSIEGLDQKQERFMSMLAFFLLFGLAVAVLVGAIYPGKKKG